MGSLLGLFSGGGGGDPSGQTPPAPNYVDPRLLAIIGGIKGMADANPPQAASRLPLARPSLGYQLAQGLGGFGQGLLSGQQATNNNLANFSAAQKIKLMSDAMGGTGAFASGQPQPQGQGLDAQAGPAAMDAAATAGARPGPTPQAAGLLSGQPNASPPPMVGPQSAAPTAGGSPFGLGRQQLLGSMVADMFGKTAGDIYSKQFPGPTELTRAYTDWQNAPAAAKPLYAQKLMTSAGDRFQLMRNGWAFDKVENKWLHMPSLGEGVTGTMDAQGNLSASPVPGAQSAISALAGAKTGAEESAKAGVALGDLYRPSGAGAPPVPPIIPGKGGVSKGPPTPGLNQPVTTQAGTQIPPISEAAPLSNAPAYLEKRIPQWAETENKWHESLDSNYIAEQRGLAIADALKKTESGQWATEKGTVSASLKAIGIDIPNDILGDPAQVQRALKDNFAQTLAQIRGFTSRPAAAEVILGQKNFSNPNLQPEANLSILGETVGQMRWERALMQDYSQAKTMGWRDPQDFQRAWSKLNPLQGFIDKTKAEIGPLKGMPGSPGSAAPQIQEGATAINPATKQRIIMKGGQWQPLP